MKYLILLIISVFLTITKCAESVYNPESVTKTKVPRRENLNRQYVNQVTQTPLMIHSRYSHVKMYHPITSDNQYTRSDYQPSASNYQPLRVTPPSRDLSTSYSENELEYGTECPLNGTGQFPYLMDCRQFLNCWKGRGFIQSCAPGTLFNPTTRECDFPSKVVCASLDNPGRLDISSNTYAQHGNTQNTNIRANLNLRENTKPKVECEENASGLFEHPYDCRKFLNCANGVTYIQDCGIGTVFNPAYKICDWPHNVHCGTKLVEDISTTTSSYTHDNLQDPYTGEGTIEARSYIKTPNTYASTTPRSTYVYQNGQTQINSQHGQNSLSSTQQNVGRYNSSHSTFNQGSSSFTSNNQNIDDNRFDQQNIYNQRPTPNTQQVNLENQQHQQQSNYGQNSDTTQQNVGQHNLHHTSNNQGAHQNHNHNHHRGFIQENRHEQQNLNNQRPIQQPIRGGGVVTTSEGNPTNHNQGQFSYDNNKFVFPTGNGIRLSGGSHNWDKQYSGNRQPVNFNQLEYDNTENNQQPVTLSSVLEPPKFTTFGGSSQNNEQVEQQNLQHTLSQKLEPPLFVSSTTENNFNWNQRSPFNIGQDNHVSNNDQQINNPPIYPSSIDDLQDPNWDQWNQNSHDNNQGLYQNKESPFASSTIIEHKNNERQPSPFNIGSGNLNRQGNDQTLSQKLEPPFVSSQVTERNPSWKQPTFNIGRGNYDEQQNYNQNQLNREEEHYNVPNLSQKLEPPFVFSPVTEQNPILRPTSPLNRESRVDNNKPNNLPSYSSFNVQHKLNWDQSTGAQINNDRNIVGSLSQTLEPPFVNSPNLNQQNSNQLINNNNRTLIKEDQDIYKQVTETEQRVGPVYNRNSEKNIPTWNQNTNTWENNPQPTLPPTNIQSLYKRKNSSYTYNEPSHSTKTKISYSRPLNISTNLPYYTNSKPNSPQNISNQFGADSESLPISEAMKVLLRPYMKGNVNETALKILEQSLIPQNNTQNLEDFYDQFVSLEQENLNQGRFEPDDISGEQMTTPIPETSSKIYLVYNNQRPTISNHTTNNNNNRWPHNHNQDRNYNHNPSNPNTFHLGHNYNHSVDFHRRNPHLPTPPTFVHNSSFHRGFYPNSNFNHTVEFHRRVDHSYNNHNQNDLQFKNDNPYGSNPYNPNPHSHHNTYPDQRNDDFVPTSNPVNSFTAKTPGNVYTSNSDVTPDYSDYYDQVLISSSTPASISTIFKYPTYSIRPPSIPVWTTPKTRITDQSPDVNYQTDRTINHNISPTGVVRYPNPSASTPRPFMEIPCMNKFACGNGICINQQQVCDGHNDCGNRQDESQCDHVGYEVRLSSDSGNTYEGRVEVKAYGYWGYICDDKFGMRDADVLCKELGFPLGASEVRANSFYSPNVNMSPSGSTLFMMDELDCLGNETSLKECNFDGWGVHDCNPEEIVGVVCKIPVMTCPLNFWLCDTSQECIPTGFLCDNVFDCADRSDESANHCTAVIETRLVGGKSNMEGRLEIKYRGIWGTVCDDDFGHKEAQIVCRSFGFGGLASVAKNTFEPGTGQIWLDQVLCIGNETSIDQCSHWHWGEHNCAHTEDVGIRCTAGPVLPYQPPVHTNVKTGRSRPVTENEQDHNLLQEERSSKIFPDQCGLVKAPEDDSLNDQNVGFKVIDGTYAKRGHHPWQATIRVHGQGISSHWCGAVIFSRYHLLTAAHCLVGFPKGAYVIRLGDHNSEVEEDSEIEIYIENIYIHEDFRKGQHMNNDLAMIVLKRPVRFTNYIQPICMPDRNINYTPGMNCTISGWGSVKSGKSAPSVVLRSGNVPILSSDVCRQPQVYGNVITDGMFCAGTLDEGVDACDGDSGGPLVCNHNGVNTLYGIISWGQHCGFINKPGVYTKISYYSDWIQSKINQSMISYGV